MRGLCFFNALAWGGRRNMGAALQEQWLMEWTVTADKVAKAVGRIIAAGNPQRILAYGSRARGDYSADSDLDLAVIERNDPCADEHRLSCRHRCVEKFVIRMASPGRNPYEQDDHRGP